MKLLILIIACIPVTIYGMTTKSICVWKKQLSEEKNEIGPILETGNRDNLPPVSEGKGLSYEYSKELKYFVDIQINNELQAFYSYLSMSRFFGRVDYFLEGFAKYFHDAAMEELKHAQMFMKYQSMRGGKIAFRDITAPVEREWKNGKEVFKTALDLERNITKEILCLHYLATHQFGDSDFINFLDDDIIPEQYKGMYEIESKIKTLERACYQTKSTNSTCEAYPLYELQFDIKLQDSK